MHLGPHTVSNDSLKTEIHDVVDANLIRQIAAKEYKYAANAAWSHTSIRDELLLKVKKEIGRECQQLCSTRSMSLLQKCKPEDLVTFSDAKFQDELRERAPVFYSCLHEATMSTRQQRRKQEHSAAPPITMAASVLLKQRCSKMSAQAYRFSIGVLWHSGAKKQVRNITVLLFR